MLSLCSLEKTQGNLIWCLNSRQRHICFLCIETRLSVEGFYETLQETDTSCVRGRENLYTSSDKALSQSAQRACEPPSLGILTTQLPKTPENLICLGVSPGLPRMVGSDQCQAYYPTYVVL